MRLNRLFMEHLIDLVLFLENKSWHLEIMMKAVIY
jgi:hypothetical protein